MIKSVDIELLAKSSEDFSVLVKLLESLGLRKGFVGENDFSRSATFLPRQLRFNLIYRKKPWDDADLSVMVSDLDTALDLVKRQDYNVVREQLGREPEHSIGSFCIKLPGGTLVAVWGPRVIENVADTDHLALEGELRATGKRFAIVVSRFNSFIVERLLAAAIDGLVRCGAKLGEDIELIRVPGAFEIPLAARKMAETGKYDAIICLGCLLRGDTAHYDVIVNEVTRGIGQSAQETGVPHAFGVLTCENLEQAIDRAGLKMGNKGFEAALAAVEMASLKDTIGGQRLAVSEKQVSRSARNDKVKKRNDTVKKQTDQPEKRNDQPKRATAKTKRRK
ncbi:MAG: 6,7-dimethyl-8-ribityllumazine synthase [Candidatus Sulfotelmatobacter sp.]